MADFTVRIELHNATSSDYETLYDKMKTKGFRKTTLGERGNYELPSAEYDYSSDTRNCGDVRDLAYDVAKSVKKDPSVLVTEAKNRSWIGLKKI
ncbi:DUF2622 domain-containing protein [Xenorhabdus bovienii]|uniref:DUF2622 domain-containing protein n=1 Tax=Xenorhabdus bovienii TaxID=40576 RepID=UPI002157D597|nr:DUF2622 domain-containing protein [Xenorhabdus bovienii]